MTNVIELAVVTGTTLAFPNPTKLHKRGERVRAKANIVVMAKKKKHGPKHPRFRVSYNTNANVLL